MLSFQISKKNSEKLWRLNDLISEKNALVRGLNQEEGDAIHRYARISQIGASTRIENAVLTDPEVDWMDTILSKDAKTTSFPSRRRAIEAKLSKDRERSIEEVAGCRAMLNILYEQAFEIFPLTESHIRGLHKECLGFYPKAASYLGKYKSHSNKVVETNHSTGKQRVVFDTAPPGTITETGMASLVAWYNEAITQEPWTVAVACEFTFRFLAIHPFQDGNGRVGRGLFLLALLQSPNKALVNLARYLAIDRQIERHREEYYLVLNRCSQGKFLSDPKRYKIEYFLAFMTKILEDALNDIDLYKRKYSTIRDLSPSAQKVLACFKDQPEIRLKTKQICDVTKLPRRTVVQVLSTLLASQVIQKYGRGAGVRYQLVF